ncbi:MAG: hypothetical protein WC584_02375 [Candidatus Pacearchaeota archaeon]
MAVGVTLLIVAVAVIAIYVLVELKRFRHKIFAILLIALILFVYLTAIYVFKGKDVNLKTASGFIEGVKIYFSWLLSAFGNLKTITANAIHMDWGGNKSIG